MLGEKGVKPITQTKRERKTKLSYLFKNQEKTKPVVFNKQTYKEQYYETFGIIYTGSDLGSSVTSIIS